MKEEKHSQNDTLGDVVGKSVYQPSEDGGAPANGRWWHIAWYYVVSERRKGAIDKLAPSPFGQDRGGGGPELGPTLVGSEM